MLMEWSACNGANTGAWFVQILSETGDTLLCGMYAEEGTARR